MDASARRTRIAVAIAFAAQGLAFAAILTHLPAFKTRYGVGDGVVTAIVLGVSLLAGAGTALAGWLTGRRGSAVALRSSLLTITVAVVVIAVAPDLAVLCAGFAVYGIGVGGLDATMNMQAVALQHRYGRSILTSFHAAWSAAGIVGALYTSGTERWNLPLPGVLLVIAAATLASAVYVTGRLADRTADVELTAVTAQAPPVPWRPVLLLGAAMVCFYVADSGTSSWSSIYLHDVLHASSSVAALAYAGYTASSLLSRVAGDHLVRGFGGPAVVRAAGVIGGIGLLVVVLAHSAVVAIAGFIVLGLGIAVIAPLSFAAAGELSPGAADRVVAQVNVFNYIGFVVGGVIVGLFGTAGTLRWGFVVPLVLTLAIVVLAPAFHPRAATAGTVPTGADR